MDKPLPTEKEILQFSISRYDHYYDSVNNKSNVYMAVSTFAIGALTALYISLTKQCNTPLAVYIALGILIFISICILFMVINAATPKLTKLDNSLIYFRSVSALGHDEFCLRSREQKEEDSIQDLRSQAYFLAKGLTSKFCWLRYASWLFMGQIVLLIITFLLILIFKTN